MGCLAGKYKSSIGSELCTDCDVDSYSVVSEARNISTCSSCPVNSISLPGSDDMKDCICDTGSSGPDGGMCVKCDAGTHKLAAGAAECKACGTNMVSDSGSAMCTACSAGKLLETGTNTCFSDILRIIGDMTVRVSLEQFNTKKLIYKQGIADVNDVHVDNVQILDVSEVDAVLRRRLLTGSAGLKCTYECTMSKSRYQERANITNAVVNNAFRGTHDEIPVVNQVVTLTCGMGHSYDTVSDTCKPCLPGYWQFEQGNAMCIQCTPNTFAHGEKNTVCTACPAHSGSDIGSHECVCVHGFAGPPGGPCSPCAAGQYSSDAKCMSCPAHASSRIGSAALVECQCNAGFTGADGNVCAACAVGTFKAGSGSGACHACPAHSSSGGDGGVNCTCHKGFEGPGCTALKCDDWDPRLMAAVDIALSTVS